jgi:hypothetical protein
MKTSELTGYILDRAVMQCEGLSKWLHGRIKYSSDWSEAGPIIEREKISVSPRYDDANIWSASIFEKEWGFTLMGDTPLIAAMRCYVASKLGDEIDVPVEWMEGK